MKGRIIIALCIISVSATSYGQLTSLDSLKLSLPHLSNDTLRLVALGRITNGYRELNSDSARVYATKTQALANDLKMKLEESQALTDLGYAFMNLGNYPRALESFFSAVAISEDPESEKEILPKQFVTFDEFIDRYDPPRSQRLSVLSRTYQDMAILYIIANDYSKAKNYCERAIALADEAKNLKILSIVYSTLGRTYLFLNKGDSALSCQQKSYSYAQLDGYTRYTGSALLNLGRAYLALGDRDNAKSFFKQSLAESMKKKYYRGVVASNLELAKLFREENLKDSSFYYATAGTTLASNMAVPELLLRCYRELANYYSSISKSDSSSKYLSTIVELNDKLSLGKRMQEFQNIDFDEEHRRRQLEAAEAAYRHKLSIYAMAGAIFVVVVIAIVLFKSNQQKQKAKTRIESAFQQLKATQSQLIQSEKMASLGELTAGIAHEIQNPLNFVNNFSEVNKELLEDLNDELDRGNVAGAKALARDIFNNQEKINHHGKRADGIVKNMLQHSLKSTGQKSPTDLNSLCDEYLRLAYHGLRARDKTFNANIEKDFTSGLPVINVISQDIGRVILNLVNNALYAVGEKTKTLRNGYSPLVKVSTRMVADYIHITVQDNGHGIAESIKEKIFHPFFTTKPPGQGTGLGLSLAYDIITKGHGGKLIVETVEGEGTSFLVMLPANSKM